VVRSRGNHISRAVLGGARRIYKLIASKNWGVLLEEVGHASDEVGSTRARLKKIESLADVIRRLSPEEVPIAVSYFPPTLCA
jgi:hypothetical protein